MTQKRQPIQKIKTCVLVFLQSKENPADFTYKCFEDEDAADFAIKAISESLKADYDKYKLVKDTIRIASKKDIRKEISIAQRIVEGKYGQVSNARN